MFTGRLVVERDIDDQFVRIDAPTLGWVETGAEVPTGTYDVTVYVTGREKARLVEHEHYEREDSTLDELQAQSFEHFWIVLSEPPVS